MCIQHILHLFNNITNMHMTLLNNNYLPEYSLREINKCLHKKII